MNAVSVVASVLLVTGVLAALLSCLGMLLVRDPYDRLHYAGPANTIAPVAIAAAVALRAGLGPTGIKALAVAAVLVSTNVALTHATARAIRIRQHGRWTVEPEHHAVQGPDPGPGPGPGPAGGREPPAGEAGPA